MYIYTHAHTSQAITMARKGRRRGKGGFGRRWRMLDVDPRTAASAPGPPALAAANPVEEVAPGHIWPRDLQEEIHHRALAIADSRREEWPDGRQLASPFECFECEARVRLVPHRGTWFCQWCVDDEAESKRRGYVDERTCYWKG